MTKLSIKSTASPLVSESRTIEAPWLRMLQDLVDKVNELDARPEFAPMAAKIVSVTRPTGNPSDTQQITGVGFKPTALIVVGVDTSHAGLTSGVAVDGTAGSVTIGTGAVSSGASLLRLGSPGLDLTATVQSLDDDGFTLAWTNNVYPSGGNVVASVLCLK